MVDRISAPDVGSQDPALRNSPIAEEGAEEAEALRQGTPAGPVCYFNDNAYRDGMYVRSGGLLLRCDRGLWVPVGPSDPDNP